MAEPVKSGTRSKEEIEKWTCNECEAVPPGPEVTGWEALAQLGRTISSLFGGGSEHAQVATKSFHDLSGRLISGEQVKFDMFKGKFGKQEKGTNEQIGNFITGRLTNSNFAIFEKCHVNGRHTHPAWHFCRYNAQETRNRSSMRPIPWNFAKFVIDRDGQVLKYYSPKVPPSKIKPDIEALLAGKIQAPASQPPTIKPQDAPPGFLSSRPVEKPNTSADGSTLF